MVRIRGAYLAPALREVRSMLQVQNPTWVNPSFPKTRFRHVVVGEHKPRTLWNVLWGASFTSQQGESSSMVHSYVPGPNIAKGAECDPDVLLLRQSLISSRQTRPASCAGDQQQQRHHENSPGSRCRAYHADHSFGAPWVREQGLSSYGHL